MTGKLPLGTYNLMHLKWNLQQNVGGGGGSEYYSAVASVGTQGAVVPSELPVI